MPNKNYIKGRNKEYDCMSRLKKVGYLTHRTAGSHSAADVIAFLIDVEISDQPLVRYIQIKSMAKQNRSMVQKERRKLAKIFLPRAVSRELWVYLKGIKEPEIHYIAGGEC